MLVIKDQVKAIDNLFAFVEDPTQSIYVLNGFAGVGKTHTISQFMKQYSDMLKVNKSFDIDVPPEILLTATTHKAVEALRDAAKSYEDDCPELTSISTYNSAFGLISFMDYKTGKQVTRLRDPHFRDIPQNSLVIIDEASMLTTFEYIHKAIKAVNIKVLLVGDEDQLTVGYSSYNDLDKQFPISRLTTLVRNDSEIADLAHSYRKVLHGHNLPSNIDVGGEIEYIADHDEFIDTFVAEYKKDSQIKLGVYDNNSAMYYNTEIHSRLGRGDHFQVGQIVTALATTSYQGKLLISNNGEYLIQEFEPKETTLHTFQSGIELTGNEITVNGQCGYYVKDVKLLNKALKELRTMSMYVDAEELDSKCFKLSHSYVSTIHKTQGSTHTTMYLDLNTISKARSLDTFARLMYVGISRASEKLILTGDLADKYIGD